MLTGKSPYRRRRTLENKNDKSFDNLVFRGLHPLACLIQSQFLNVPACTWCYKCWVHGMCSLQSPQQHEYTFWTPAIFQPRVVVVVQSNSGGAFQSEADMIGCFFDTIPKFCRCVLTPLVSSVSLFLHLLKTLITKN